MLTKRQVDRLGDCMIGVIVIILALIVFLVFRRCDRKSPSEVGVHNPPSVAASTSAGLNDNQETEADKLGSRSASGPAPRGRLRHILARSRVGPDRKTGQSSTSFC